MDKLRTYCGSLRSYLPSLPTSQSFISTTGKVLLVACVIGLCYSTVVSGAKIKVNSPSSDLVKFDHSYTNHPDISSYKFKEPICPDYGILLNKPGLIPVAEDLVLLTNQDGKPSISSAYVAKAIKKINKEEPQKSRAKHYQKLKTSTSYPSWNLEVSQGRRVLTFGVTPPERYANYKKMWKHSICSPCNTNILDSAETIENCMKTANSIMSAHLSRPMFIPGEYREHELHFTAIPTGPEQGNQLYRDIQNRLGFEAAEKFRSTWMTAYETFDGNFQLMLKTWGGAPITDTIAKQHFCNLQLGFFIPIMAQYVPREMKKFSKELYRVTQENEDPIAVAAWALATAKRIQAFTDGNGTLGRYLMHVVLLKAGYPVPIFDSFHDYVRSMDFNREQPGYFSNYLTRSIIKTHEKIQRGHHNITVLQTLESQKNL